MSYPVPANEVERLRTLRSYKILNTKPEERFDELTRLAALICGVPISLISLIDTDRQWCKSQCGLDLDETPRARAFCTHAIMQPRNVRRSGCKPGRAIRGKSARDWR